ncbi:hypothetical protein [Luteimonas sp. RC10]|uniref:hypothetical protein n=1 Tax=Luteimonas sp. RC10 TaxID=2587035 RepID=UPI001609830B|nr:hypothetical protein [Luteimonas sp. RC10]MBB3344864.1 hypothetical protein [Luteimonas sp. RC10]
MKLGGSAAPLLSIFLLTALSIFMAPVLPVIFDGIGVYSARGGIDSQHNNLTPLRVTPSIFIQPAYLLLSLFCFLFFSLNTKDKLRHHIAHRWISIGAILVLLFGAWRLASLLSGIYFPSEILYSSGIKAENVDQTINGIYRVSSTFTEVSYLGVYLVSALAYFLRYAYATKSLMSLLISAAITLLIAITTSSTAYLSAAVLIACFLAFVVVKEIGKGRLSKRTLATLSLSLLAAFIMVLYFSDNTIVRSVVDLSITTKASSGSATHRGAADIRALQIVYETFGLGVGLGANRPSSLITSIVSNLGIIGLTLFLTFVYQILKVTARVANALPASESSHRAVLLAARWGFFFCFVSMAIAVPDLSFPIFWLWAITMTYVAGSLRADTGQ